MRWATPPAPPNDHRFRDGSINREEFSTRVAPLQDTIQDLLRQGAACNDSRVEGMCKDILTHGPALWTFVSVPGVEPTNNIAEQAIRPFWKRSPPRRRGVKWRKGSFGTQSERGSRFTARMASVIQTCRRQGRHLLTFIEQTISCRKRGSPPPSLIANPM